MITPEQIRMISIMCDPYYVHNEIERHSRGPEVFVAYTVVQLELAISDPEAVDLLCNWDHTHEGEDFWYAYYNHEDLEDKAISRLKEILNLMRSPSGSIEQHL